MRWLSPVLAVLMAACSGSGGTPTANTAMPPASSTSTSTTAPGPTLPAGYELSEKTETIATSNPGIQVQGHMLVVGLPDAQVAARVNEGLTDLLDTLADEVAASEAAGQFIISPEVVLFDRNVLSVRWLVSGAGILWVETSTYDLDAGTQVGLSDVLAGANAVLLVSDLVSRSLIDEIHGGDPAALAAYADPVVPRHIAYGPGGIEVYFDPGEVAVAATGVVTVQVPWSELAPFVRPDGVFAGFGDG